jgi:hypothetical protein
VLAAAVAIPAAPAFAAADLGISVATKPDARGRATFTYDVVTNNGTDANGVTLRTRCRRITVTQLAAVNNGAPGPSCNNVASVNGTGVLTYRRHPVPGDVHDHHHGAGRAGAVRCADQYSVGYFRRGNHPNVF